jgi:hypothetical protein
MAFMMISHFSLFWHLKSVTLFGRTSSDATVEVAAFGLTNRESKFLLTEMATDACYYFGECSINRFSKRAKG